MELELEFSDKMSMLGVTLGSDLSWNDHIPTTTGKAAACKLGLLFRSRRYFTILDPSPQRTVPLDPTPPSGLIWTKGWGETIGSPSRQPPRGVGGNAGAFPFQHSTIPTTPQRTPSSLITLYKAQIRPCLEFGSPLWTGAFKHSLATLDAIQK